MLGDIDGSILGKRHKNGDITQRGSLQRRIAGSSTSRLCCVLCFVLSFVSCFWDRSSTGLFTGFVG